MTKKANLGKPSGITLYDHTLHVIEQAEYILKALPFLAKKYNQITGGDLKEELIKAAKYHDWGKVYPKWQEACQADNSIYKKWRIENELAPDKIDAVEHRKFELDMHFKEKMAAPNLFGAKLRHEFASLHYLSNSKIKVSPIVKAAIAAHHGKLGYRFEETRWKLDGIKDLQSEGPFFKYWKELKRLSFKNKHFTANELLIERYRFAAVRSLLQLTDTRASRLEGEGENAFYKFEKFVLSNKYENLRPVQEAAKELANESISILRAPTGSGKTYAALLWADLQINPINPEIVKADRLVIAMPTRFTSNALSISVSEQIDETGLYHSSAWYNRYGDLNDKEAIKYAREAHRMAKLLTTPVSVCTIDHLLISLTATKESHHSTFFFLANSAVVFDEADFYDAFVQANIVVLLEVLRALKVPVLIMSATVPDSARKLYKVKHPIKIPKYDKLDCVKMLKWVEASSELEYILLQMLKKGTGIIYANTVARAIEYYRFLEGHPKRNKIPLTIYHSRFTEPSKKDIEEKLINNLGKTAWENNNSKPVNGIAIMTQIGEMSVNISTPIMISDLCPWDRLAQRIGRLVRFDEAKEGICYVVKPMKDGFLYPAPYGEYDRKERVWKAIKPLINTEQDLKKSFSEPTEVTPKDLEIFVNELYPSAPEIIGQALYNQREYRNLIKDNWLILPNKYIDEDDGLTDKWSSRHISPQQIVFIEFKPRFTSYADYQEHALQYGISCPIYTIEKELRKGEDRSKIGSAKVTIGKNEEEILVYYIDEQDYDENMGLAFLYEPETNDNF